MNCKPGDLAIIVGSRSNPECNGIIVMIDRYAGDKCWYVRGKLIEEYARIHGLGLKLFDARLRPIRDNPGEDEMLRIAGKPTELTD